HRAGQRGFGNAHRDHSGRAAAHHHGARDSSPPVRPGHAVLEAADCFPERPRGRRGHGGGDSCRHRRFDRPVRRGRCRAGRRASRPGCRGLHRPGARGGGGRRLGASARQRGPAQKPGPSRAARVRRRGRGHALQLPLRGSALYVIGGIDSAGRAQPSVLAADVTPDSVVGRFAPIAPLPAPVVGATAVVRRGRIYVIGGTDSLGRPQRSVFVGRIAAAGHIDGWYRQPLLPTPRAYGGGVVLDDRAVAFGGVADSVPPGGGLDPATTRLASSDTAPVSLVSGFFAGSWASGATLIPAPRSQFATLDLGEVVLRVGGMYGGAAAN